MLQDVKDYVNFKIFNNFKIFKYKIMANTIKLELTKAQFTCLIDVIDTISAMSGCDLDFTKEQEKNVRLLDRMLLKNGYKRKYK